MILVPMKSAGITLLRPMSIFGDAEPPKGHMEILFEDVRVPFSSVLASEGHGFEIAQASATLPAHCLPAHCLPAQFLTDSALTLTYSRTHLVITLSL